MNRECFSCSQWIWPTDTPQADEYAEFVFLLKGGKNTRIRIAADSDYNLYAGGRLVAFGQYSGYHDYSIYDTVELGKYLAEAGTEIRIVVWYYGVDSQNYIKNAAGLIFEVENDGEIIESSGRHIRSRLYDKYQNHYQKQITSQIGYSYKYYGNREASGEFGESVIVARNKLLFPRPNEKLILGERPKTDITEFEDGFLVDMKEETVGFLELDFESDIEQDILIVYGEYLFGGQVRYLINGIMNYSVEYVAKKGRNVFESRFRRLAGRYLQIFCKSPLKVNYAGLRSVVYPFKEVEHRFMSPIRNDIYRTSVKTLLSCAHEHFEDCPWREQALYTMDSRNEMLCAYEAFGDFTFARSNLVLISHGLRDDGLLSICYPSGIDIPIPFFSLIYPVQVSEYVLKSGDKSIIGQVYPVIKKIMDNFADRIEDNGLIDEFPYPCWNFYEWAAGSVDVEHRDRQDPNEKLNRFDLNLNCAFLIAVKYASKLAKEVGDELKIDVNKVKAGIRRELYDAKKGLFRVRNGENLYTALGNSLAVIAGVGEKEVIDRIITDPDVVPITLSMNTFLYDAMLATDGEKYKHFVLKDIDYKYGNMLKKGATTFWETEEGAAALGDTGSLCHGWAAMPIYYYSLLNGKKYFDGTL